MNLSGNTVLLTGGSSGIGLALAERFGAAGMKVVMADIERPVLAREAERLAAEGLTALRFDFGGVGDSGPGDEHVPSEIVTSTVAARARSAPSAKRSSVARS